jgi:quinone-modifying oxidoreductase subunit QmoC
MSDQYLVEPNLEFINEVVGLGGDTLKKCFQCATCSVACPIAPENSPFPRKEMIAASWGLKDKLVGSADIWLCHECGDCTALCPRGAKPGDVLSAIRSYAITDYAAFKPLAKAVTDRKKLVMLTAIPAVWFAVMAFITMFMGDTMSKIFHFFGLHWVHETDAAIAHAKFVSSWLVDFTFVPVFTASIVLMGLSLKKMLQDMHNNALLEGKTAVKTFDLKEYLKTIPAVITKIAKHTQFNECGENKARGTAHMMVLFGFIGCFIATALAAPTLYLLGIAGPYSQLAPIKWFGNIGGIFIVMGSALMIKERLAKAEMSAYKDWYLLGLVIGLGASGLLTQMARLADMAFIAYLLYYVHLILIFHLFAYLPYSKIAHAVYRVAGMTYAEYAKRK